MHRVAASRTLLRWLLFVSIFVLTAGFRYLALGSGFPNDHFVYITGGWQMLFGEWPTRDWVDPGLPLMFAASALAQAVLGQTLFAEAVLVSVAFGLAASLTAAAVLESTGSLRLALAAALLEVTIFPRTYGYPKVLVYAAAFWCFARYVNRPGTARAAAIAVAVAVAFLFRHDHGLFLGAAGALTILLAPERERHLGVRWRHAAAYVTTGVVLVLPYLAYVQLNGGLGSYVRTGIEFSRREAVRQWHVWPKVIGDPEPLLSALVYEFYLIPIMAVAVLATRRSRPQFPRAVALIVPAVLVALMVNYNFIRDPLVTRLPDAIVPALVLGSWLLTVVVSTVRHRWPARVLAASLVLLFTASATAAGDIANNLGRTDLATEWDHPRRLLASRTASLQARLSDRQIPSPAVAGLRPFLAYVDRCTTPEHRLLIGGYLVELPFFAQRRFAAGQAYFGGSFEGEHLQGLALRRLRQQTVPLAIFPSDYAGDFEARFPLVADYVRSRYATLSVVPINDEVEVSILVDTALRSSGRDAETGWPCFLPR